MTYKLSALLFKRENPNFIINENFSAKLELIFISEWIKMKNLFLYVHEENCSWIHDDIFWKFYKNRYVVFLAMKLELMLKSVAWIMEIFVAFQFKKHYRCTFAIVCLDVIKILKEIFDLLSLLLWVQQCSVRYSFNAFFLLKL